MPVAERRSVATMENGIVKNRVCSSKLANGNRDVWSSKESESSSADHLVVMVHGIRGTAADWKFGAEQFVRTLPDKVIVHCSCGFDTQSIKMSSSHKARTQSHPLRYRQPFDRQSLKIRSRQWTLRSRQDLRELQSAARRSMWRCGIHAPAYKSWPTLGGVGCLKKEAFAFGKTNGSGCE
ncbi:hypothetical protein ACFX13_014498 [Malus domestica]|uniref:DUF676 domain-containing protein n=1 Tax=Malus domestica TaxID=3750 RepID=A0A498HYA7_MALDO|nr:hypothetical protein DVH24_019496 [Malus domestica]